MFVLRHASLTISKNKHKKGLKLKFYIILMVLENKLLENVETKQNTEY